MNGSKRVALIATFATITAISDSIPGIPQFESGVWYSWVFLMEPIVGLILGPSESFLSMLIGVLVGHYIFFRGPYEFLFALGSPIGASIASILFRKRTGVPKVYYTALLTAYFLTPISHNLPLWGMWNVYLAFITLLGISYLRFEKTRLLTCAFIGLEADILFRIFLFVPLQTYRIFYGFTFENVRLIWIAGAFMTPVQVGLSLLFTAVAYPNLKKMVNVSLGNFFG